MQHDAQTIPLDEQLDQEARHHARQLEYQGRLEGGFTDHYYPLTRGELRELNRLIAALRLADTPAVFCALARGEAVPRHRVRPSYLRLVERWPE